MDVNVKRVPPLYFGCFEVVNQRNDVSERMLRGKDSVWELLAKWELDRDICLKKKDEAPIYIFMIKVIFNFKVRREDRISIGMLFS